MISGIASATSLMDPAWALLAHYPRRPVYICRNRLNVSNGYSQRHTVPDPQPEQELAGGGRRAQLGAAAPQANRWQSHFKLRQKPRRIMALLLSHTHTQKDREG